MSKFIVELNQAIRAFDSIDFDRAQLADNPEALAAHVASMQTDGIADLKTRIETLEGQNAALQESNQNLGDLNQDLKSRLEESAADPAAAQELLDEAQEIIAAKETEAKRFQETLSAVMQGFADAGIRIDQADGQTVTAEAIAAAIKAKQSIAASEVVASFGFKAALVESDSHDADSNTSSDPYAGMTGIQQAAAAIKARNASR